VRCVSQRVFREAYFTECVFLISERKSRHPVKYYGWFYNLSFKIHHSTLKRPRTGKPLEEWFQVNWDKTPYLVNRISSIKILLRLAGTQYPFPIQRSRPSAGDVIRFKSLGCTQGYSRFDPFRVSLITSIFPRISLLSTHFRSVFHRTKWGVFHKVYFAKPISPKVFPY